MREEKRKMPKRQKVLKSQIQTCSLIFSDNKMTKFSERYENGYDITSDERYNMWLAILSIHRKPGLPQRH